MADTTTSRPGLGRRLAVRLQTVRQLFGALSRSPFWWLAPFCVILPVFAVLLIFVQAIPGAAPFLYTLF